MSLENKRKTIYLWFLTSLDEMCVSQVPFHVYMHHPSRDFVCYTYNEIGYSLTLLKSIYTV